MATFPKINLYLSDLAVKANDKEWFNSISKLVNTPTIDIIKEEVSEYIEKINTAISADDFNEVDALVFNFKMFLKSLNVNTLSVINPIVEKASEKILGYILKKRAEQFKF